MHTSDAVNHPPHYTSHPSGIEVIEITKHMNFTLGNVIKYVLRHEHKGGLEDLKKARWYLNCEIEKLEKQQQQQQQRPTQNLLTVSSGGIA